MNEDYFLLRIHMEMLRRSEIPRPTPSKASSPENLRPFPTFLALRPLSYLACPSSIFREAGYGLWREIRDETDFGPDLTSKLAFERVRKSRKANHWISFFSDPFILRGCVPPSFSSGSSVASRRSHLKPRSRIKVRSAPFLFSNLCDSSLGFHPFLATNFVRISPSSCFE